MGVFAGGRVVRKAMRALLALVMVLILAFLFASSPAARAQDEGGDKAGDKADTGKVPDAPPAPAPPPNLFRHIVVSAGPFFGGVLLLVSIGLVALIVLLSMDLRMQVALPPAFVDEFTETVNKRKFREAFDLARGDQSYLARVLTAGMGRLQYGIE